VRPCEPQTFSFADDGRIPNNPLLPLVIYPKVVALDAHDPAAVFEGLFAANGWADSWRNGIYPYAHFHAGAHEVLGVARGHARVRFGGDSGAEIDIAAGDVAVLPAGTGHQRIAASADLLVVGAYPPSGRTAAQRPSADTHDYAVKAIAAVKLPESDPVFGRDGPLLRLWRR
jgi:uncharacterized protein YjlB